MAADQDFVDSLSVRPIGRDIDLSRFKCDPIIDAFLRERVCEHHEKRFCAATCWLHGDDLVGYMTTSMGYTRFTDSKWWRLIQLAGIKLSAGGKDQENFPAMLIGMLGVHVDYRGRGIAKRMVRTAIVYAMDAASTIGCRIVHVDSDRTPDAMRLYAGMGFTVAEGQEKRSKAWMYFDLKERTPPE